MAADILLCERLCQKPDYNWQILAFIISWKNYSVQVTFRRHGGRWSKVDGTQMREEKTNTT